AVLTALAALALGMSPASAAVPGATVAAAATAAVTVAAPACGQVRAQHASCFARMHVSRDQSGRVRPAATSAPAGGYTPSDLQAAYALPVSSGSGQVIAVIDAFDTTSAEADLAAYRARFNLPPCTTANGCFRKIDMGGGSNTYGWDIETSLDLDTASAGCPRCGLILVEARSDSFGDIYPAIQRAIDSGATEVSMSFGMTENPDELNHDYLFNRSGIAFTAATGDCGYGTSYPAASPYVTAVGGTTLLPSGNLRGWRETAWVGATADPNSCGGSTAPTGAGSGCSRYEQRPSWQADVGCPNNGRAVADVSAVSDLSTGVAVYDSAAGGWMPIGGTSAAAPFIAGAWALSGGLGYYAPGAQAFYQNAGSISDVTANTHPAGVSCSPSLLCNAGPAYDGPTGLGSLVGGLVAPALVSAPSSTGSAAFGVSWSPGAGVMVGSYTLWVQDNSGPWVRWTDTSATSATFHGFPGHTYTFHAEVHNGRFDSGPPNGLGDATTSVSGSAQTGPFTGLYAVDAYGALHPGSSPPLATTAEWPGWSIARGLALAPGGEGGYVLDGYGGLHPFGATGAMPPGLAASAYWNGWDIARGLAVAPDGQGGYVVDGWGGLHSVGNAPGLAGTAYWPGWDIARGIALNACDPSGRGGWVLDGWGGIHPFGSAPGLAGTAYWPNWDIARAIVSTCTQGTPGGYVLDGWGGIHPFGSAPVLTGSAYWPNWDIARGISVLPGGGGGYVVDGWGGFHPFGGAPNVDGPVYTPGRNLVRGAAAG
ncbi:MAG TPA: S8 family serine peptidase, partial [Candidatus Dormibacteraeota bacterium]